MWDLLIELKKDKTILLTTHFMEEADVSSSTVDKIMTQYFDFSFTKKKIHIYLGFFQVLGDRVVIMAHGKAQCNGSPMFLKRLLGDGYTLSMIKGPK